MMQDQGGDSNPESGHHGKLYLRLNRTNAQVKF